MHRKNVVLHMLIDAESFDAVYDECKLIMDLCFRGAPTPCFDRCFRDTVKLFTGRYDGYQSCTTDYHDLRHTLEVLLATVRMIHATILGGRTISRPGAELTLMAALMHDIGYIPEEGEAGGGGRYTLVHVERSAAFFEHYGPEIGLSREDVEACCCMITATSLSIDPDSISFRDPEIELLAKLVASADLLGQLADRLYLEKLLFLYREFREAGVLAYPHEFDLLNQTRAFYATVRCRLDEKLGALDKHLSLHFRERWQIDRNLYNEAITLNLQYLDIIIGKHKDDYRNKLKRGGIVDRLISAEASSEPS